MLRPLNSPDGSVMDVDGAVVAPIPGVLDQLEMQGPILFEAAMEVVHFGGGGAHFLAGFTEWPCRTEQINFGQKNFEY